ncbi:unnamed protein product [Knipowitschia caucasica]
MVSRRLDGALRLEVGLCSMEIAILLLLTVSLSAAAPLSLTQRFSSAASGDALQEAEGARSEQTLHAPALRIVPFLQEEKLPIREALKHSMAARLRPRRAPQRGCQLGTCQLHNLANTLYHISKKNGQDESKKANDPHGYGR